MNRRHFTQTLGMSALALGLSRTVGPESRSPGLAITRALAKEKGKFEQQLRYPGEDSEYEKAKMDKLGL